MLLKWLRTTLININITLQWLLYMNASKKVYVDHSVNGTQTHAMTFTGVGNLKQTLTNPCLGTVVT